MRLILVRHGQPQHLSQPGAGNPPLSPAGHRQAQAVGAFLAKEPIDLVVHSGMHRAAETAAPLLAATGIRATAIAAIGEVDRYGGAYANIEMVKARGEAEWARFLADPLGYFGIDTKRFVAETLEGFGSILTSHHRKTAVIFTHGFPINILLSHALGLEGYANFVPDYGSITRLTGGALDRLTVVSINETAHLAHLAAEAGA
jgi:broad specificity phosphatase PhoE